MGYDTVSRKKLETEFMEKWEKNHPLKRMMLGKNGQEILAETEALSVRQSSRTKYLDSILHENIKATSLAKVIRGNLGNIVELYVPKEHIDEYYHIVDKMAQFQYTTGLSRRTLRTKRIDVHYREALELLFSYRALEFFGVSLADYLKGNLSEELLDYKNQQLYYVQLLPRKLDDMIAAAIDEGDKAVIDTVRDALLSENNTIIVDHYMVRGILKSDSDELQELLAKFLLAARLREGVRQVICENADCGTVKGFMRIMDVICENDLMRFTAVKRAVATWTGICNTNALDRISDKVFALITDTIRDIGKARELLRTDDSVNIIIGLWVLGFYEAQDAIDEMLAMVNNGTRNQRLTISYYNQTISQYNQNIQTSVLADRVAGAMLKLYGDDLEMAAAFMPTYFTKYSRYIRLDVNDPDSRRKIVTALFGNETEARTMYNVLLKIYKGMPKKEIRYNPFIFPWYSVSISKTEPLFRMAVIAHLLQDDGLIDEVCECIGKLGYGVPIEYTLTLMGNPKTPKQREMLLDSIVHTSRYERKPLYETISKLTLTEEEYLRLEQMLHFKAREIRTDVIRLLSSRPKEKLKECIARLLAAPDEQKRLGGLDLVKKQAEADTEHRDEWLAFLRTLAM